MKKAQPYCKIRVEIEGFLLFLSIYLYLLKILNTFTSNGLL